MTSVTLLIVNTSAVIALFLRSLPRCRRLSGSADARLSSITLEVRRRQRASRRADRNRTGRGGGLRRALLPAHYLLVDLGELARQRGDVLDDEIARRLAHLPQVVVAGLVHRDAERQHPGHLQFLQRDHRVLDSVGVGTAVVAVVEILRKAVAQQDHMLCARGDILEFFAHVANRGAHPGRSLWLDRADAGADLVRQFLVELLDYIELDIVAAVTGETTDRA